MTKNKKWILLITIIVGIFLIRNYNSHPRHAKIPESENIIKITLIDINNGKGVKKITIDKKSDVNKFLDILKKSKKTNEYSVSDLPNKDRYTIVMFKLSEGGKIINSIYEENNSVYFEQAYYGIFKLDYENTEELKRTIDDKGKKQDILVNIDDIFKDDF